MLAINTSRPFVRATLVVIAAWVATPTRADIVTESSASAAAIAGASGLPTPAVNRVMALVQTAVYAAANSVSRRYPDDEFNLGVVRALRSMPRSPRHSGRCCRGCYRRREPPSKVRI